MELHETTSTGEADELRYVKANGLRFAYLEAGEGPLALLVHGFPDTPHGFRELVPALVSAGYRVVAPYTRGYAPTEIPATRVTRIDELATDVLALVEALGHRSCVLVGHDWGAATAYLAAAKEPSRVEKLVTIGIPHPAALEPSLRTLWVGRHFIDFKIPGAVSRVARDDLSHIDRLYRRWSPTWRFGPEETAPVKASFADRASLDAALGYYRGFSPRERSEALRGKIRVPTLAVAGLDDPAIGVDAYEKARRKFSADYRVAALPGGHFVHRECPVAFRDAVLDFLG
ncbi:MAG: alpha/beta hydrolase [Sandaracinaceae bacterium]|nr:alpha/beta hydrolase [Sandaracinaceae bacterium]